MNEHYVKNVIEAALLAAGRPLAGDELVSLFDERDGSNPEEVTAAIQGLRSEYETRGLELVEVASGYRIQIRAAVAQPVSRLWQERPTKYSRALLETLALVAYRQPITRGEIEQIRGVAVNPNIIKTLLERAWIRVVGHRDVPGRPELLGTTRDFLDYFGLQRLDDLPTLAQLKELEDLRIQLSLPGAEPVAAAEAAPDAAAEAAPDAAADAAAEAAPEAALDAASATATATATATAEALPDHAATADADELDADDMDAEDLDADDRDAEDLDAGADDKPVKAGADDASDDAHPRLQGLVARGAADDAK
jgi:segregation and condensation protein B